MIGTRQNVHGGISIPLQDLTEKNEVILMN